MKRLLILAGGLFGHAALAHGQGAGLSPLPDQRLQAVRTDSVRSAADPAGVSEMAVHSRLTAGITASTDKSGGFVQGTLKGYGGDSTDLFFGAKLASPKPKSGDTTIASLSGLSDGTTLDLSVHLLWWRPKLDLAAAQAATAICEKHGKGRSCTYLDLDEQGRSDFEAAVIGTPVLLRFGFTSGYKAYDFLEEGSLEKASKKTLPLGFSADVAFIDIGRGFLGVGYQLAHARRPGRSVQLCMPYSPSMMSTLSCQTATIGAPKADNTHLVTAEWRRQVSERLAFDAKAGFDVEEHVAAIELPIYFLQDKDKGGLTAGVSPSWRSDDARTPGLLFFVGSAFDTKPSD